MNIAWRAFEPKDLAHYLRRLIVAERKCIAGEYPRWMSPRLDDAPYCVCSMPTWRLKNGIGPAPMHVERTHHIDASEPDDAGMYDYYYEYDIYVFKDGAVCFAARSYVDEPEEAHFVGVEVKGRSRAMVDADLEHPLFLAALAYLRAHGKKDFRWLSGRGNGYERVPNGMRGGA